MKMYNLSKPQKTIYDMSKVIGGSISTICGSMLKEGTPDIDLLKKSVNELYRLNDALRIHIKETAGQVIQYVSKYVDRDITVLTFDGEDEFLSYANNLAQQPINLTDDLAQINVVIVNSKYGIIAKLHHIIGDAWTLTLLAQQYNELISGNMPKSYSYVEYIDTEKQYLNSNRYENDKKYWLDTFKQCDEVTYLNEKEVESYIAKRKSYIIDKASTAKIQEYIQTNGASVYSLFMTLFAVYMNRIKSNCEKFYVGTAVLNRTGIKEKNTMGMYINTVPLLIDIKNEDTFANCIKKISTNSTTMFRHQKYNYMDILKAIREQYSFNEMLYDVIFSYQNAKIASDNYNFTTEWYCPCMQSESLQIHIDDRDDEGILKIHYDYLTEKFTEADIEHMHEHMFNLLYDAIDNEDKKICELEILSIDEKNKLLYEFNDTKSDYPTNKCVHQLFEEQAAKTPNKTAVIACDRTFTYDELNKISNRIANSLIEKGVKTNEIVAFALPRNSYLIPVIFGILKSGAAYMPIDPDYPQDRIDFMLEDSNAKLFITESSLSDYISNNEENPNIEMASDNYCYCIYTSGTAGNPKGTLICHRNLVNFCNNNNNNYQHCMINQGNRLISTFKCCFDAFGVDYALFLLNGLSLVLANDNEMNHTEDLAKLIKMHNVDVIHSTPSTIKSFCRNDRYVEAIKRAKIIMVAAENFTSDLYEYLSKHTSAKCFNGYGPSETTIGVSFGEINSTDITIGKPIANTQIHILDKYNQLMPIGQVGELCIAGDGVGAGYLNRPELTAEKFIDNPFGEGKLYKSGDLVYWREDGNIMFVGRNDFQVKIRGLRIELGEIENAICTTGGVSQAVVVVRKDKNGRQLICAFYTEKSSVDLSSIKKSISDKLPKYMMPHIFTRLDEMPLTPSGKINRKALPEVDLHIKSEIEYISPETDNEKLLVPTIEEILGTNNISIMDNFFDLGGDSLKAIELISKLESKGYSIEIKTIFAAETIQALALELNIKSQNILTADFVGDIPATPAQMRVYTAQNMQDGTTAYNVPYIFETYNLDAERLENAFNKLIERHESLRTQFENKDGNIVQIIKPSVKFEIEQRANNDITEFIRPFDLSKAPLLRVGYYENTVMIDMHHIISDGSTIAVLIDELNELYMERPLKKEPVQYREFALEKKDTTESGKYWLSIYNDELPELEIQTDFPRGKKQSFNGNAVYDTLDIELHSKIKEKCKLLNVTSYAYYMSAFNILLSKFSGNEDIIVGMPISGRTSKYLNTVGMFVNTIALRNKPVGTKSVVEFVNEVKENSINAIANQNYPYGNLVKKLNIDAQGRNPLFDVMFAYQSEEMTDIVFADKKAKLLPVPITTSKYDLTFNIMPRDNDVVLMAEYCTDLYKAATINRMIDGYTLILHQMLQDNILIKDICAISETEMNKLLYEFNDTKANYPKDKCVHQLFEEQVLKTPNKTAVIACDQTLTYDELNKLSNLIANALIEKDIGVGDIVAFALPRTSYLIATMFGILKSGAAYMPIDPDYPQDRIDFMLLESQAKLYITNDVLNDLIKNTNTENPNVIIRQHDIYCALHTSGSTGLPKLSLLTHKGIVSFIAAHNDFFENVEVAVSATIITFDAFIMESVVSLINGISLKLASDDEIYNQHAFETMFNRYSNAMFFATPTKMKTYIENSKTKDFMKNIHSFVIGGEIFTDELYSFIKNNSDNCNIFNIYGPTETTICAVVDELQGKDITIGKPTANAQIYILDKYNQILPIGHIGELCIAGDGVGAGYLNRPELTAEKFIDNPFGEGKLYKTGDLAYWREDGNIMFVGRNDFQVKIRGLRIELGEIENAICSTDGVSQSVVVVRKDESGRQLICAFYTEKSAVDVADIKKVILNKLPKYMLPHIFTRLDKMPLTPSGKINRKALPEIDLENISNDTEYIKPQTELQKEIARLMEQVLKYSPIGLADNFFDCGGDSLTAIEFVSKSHNEGIYFNLQAIFDNPTVKKLCEHIENGDKKILKYDETEFADINAILSRNAIENISVPKAVPAGNILIAGATGYLGIHILSNFLDNDSVIAYCLVRGENNEQSKNRLKELLQFYFNDKYSELIDTRIKVLCSDLTKDNLGLSNEDYVDLTKNVCTVINAAASVKHYGSYKYFYETNVKTVKNLIDFCFKSNAKLIHTSTLSVSGNSFGDEFDGYVSETEKHFYESSLYIGQPLENVYARSKFEAEKEILSAMANGLKANIMRMGNLTNRLSDGKFQKNYESNAFLQRVRAILNLGIFPEYLMDLYVEFTPIDEAANAVMTIARHFSEEQTVFHINSTKVVYMDKLIELFNKIGIDLRIVDGKTFTDALRQTAKQTNTEFIFETFINDMDNDDKLNYDSNIRIENNFTVKHLQNLGFEWSDIGIKYIEKYINYFREIGYWEV